MLLTNQLIGFGSGANDVFIAGITASTTAYPDYPLMVIPSGVQAGDVLIGVVSAGNPPYTWPAGWTELDDQAVSTWGATIGWKRADGTEGGTSVMLTPSSSGSSSHVCVCLRNVPSSISPVKSTFASGTSVSPNPNSVTASLGFFLTVVGIKDATTAISSCPAGYTQQSSALGSYTIAAVASKVAAPGSDDAGSWTLTVSKPWIAWTIGI